MFSNTISRHLLNNIRYMYLKACKYAIEILSLPYKKCHTNKTFQTMFPELS